VCANVTAITKEIIARFLDLVLLISVTTTEPLQETFPPAVAANANSTGSETFASSLDHVLARLTAITAEKLTTAMLPMDAFANATSCGAETTAPLSLTSQPPRQPRIHHPLRLLTAPSPAGLHLAQRSTPLPIRLPPAHRSIQSLAPQQSTQLQGQR